MDHNLAAQERENDRQDRAEHTRQEFIRREAADLAARLVDGRAYTTLCEPCNGYAPAGQRITIADEFIAWCRQQFDDGGVEAISGVLFRRQGAFDPVVREWADDYATWQADQRTDVCDDEVLYQRGGM